MKDDNKQIERINYTHGILPRHIVMSQDNQNIIYYLYTAEGQKLQKRIVEQAGSTSKTDYFGGRIYESGQLKEIAHEEGRILATTTGFEYHYYLHDHLGNVRVEFKEDADGEAAITQENHYYPFGMRFSGEVFANNDNDFRYNGKELQGDFGLDWPRFQRDCLSLRFGFAKARQSQASGEYDYGARFYDPALGRWHAVDPLADKAPGWTPYRYGFNNPMSFIDPDGRAEREQTRESQQDIPWKAKNYSSFSIEGVGGLSASNPETSVILDFYDAISGAYIGSVEVSKEGDTATGSDEGGSEGEGKGKGKGDASSQGDDLSLAGLYTHFQIGGGKVLDINMSSVDFGEATQRDLGLAGMEARDIRGVQLFRKNLLTIAGLASGRVRMRAHGNNQFSIISDESARFDFASLIDRAATLERNVGNVIGAGINYNVFLMPITPLAPVVPAIFGGPFDVNFYGTTTIPR